MASSLADWEELVDEGRPMVALEQAREILGSSELHLERTRYEVIGLIAICARKATADPDYLHELRKAKFFGDDDLGSRKVEILASRYVLGVSQVKGARYEKARLYGQLASYFAETDMTGEQVAAYLADNGVRKSLERFKEFEGTAQDSSTDLDTTCDGSPLELSEDDWGEPPMPKVEPVPAAPTRRARAVVDALSHEQARAPSRPKLDLKSTFYVESDADQLAEILCTRVGDEAKLTVRREPNHEGQEWRRFVIVEISD